jgi:hypothetical protein
MSYDQSNYQSVVDIPVTTFDTNAMQDIVRDGSVILPRLLYMYIINLIPPF